MLLRLNGSNRLRGSAPLEWLAATARHASLPAGVAALDLRRVEPIVPPPDVPFLPKQRHSVFYQTPLDHLLQVQGIERLVLVGQVTEQCIFYSALDGYLRGLQVDIPRDAVAHIVPEFAEAALGMAEKNLHSELTRAGEVDLPG